MEKMVFGIVIKVKNLTSCKAFYRDILNLGDPVLDSSFRVEFRCADSFSLILEKIFWDENGFAGPERMAWFYGSGNALDIQKKIHSHGYADKCSISVAAKAGSELCRFTDPEGNSFYVPAPKEMLKERN